MIEFEVSKFENRIFYFDNGYLDFNNSDYLILEYTVGMHYIPKSDIYGVTTPTHNLLIIFTSKDELVFHFKWDDENIKYCDIIHYFRGYCGKDDK